MDDDKIKELINDVFPGGNLIETHISWVILYDGYAYKIKKPVRFSFLDFSTLEKRLHYCVREIRLNRPLAGGMYLDVIPIFDGGSQFSLIKGKPAEYAVRMKRMDTTLQMDNMLKGGTVTGSAIDRLAFKIAHFHMQAPKVKRALKTQVVRGRFNELLNLRENAERFLSKSYAEDIAVFVQCSDEYLKQQADYFLFRANAGYVRKLHGDLHTGNILLYREPVIFDCIEFNEDLRKVDIIDEIAFLAMDIESFGCTELSCRLYTDYTALTGIFESPESRAFYRYCKFYRANIRAKVALMKLSGTSTNTEAVADRNAALKYFKLMQTYSSLLR